MVRIRTETPADIPHIRLVNESAFGQADEADIVDRLHRSDANIISLVADDGDAVIAHLLATPVVVEAGGRHVAGMALGPIAVLPDRQRQGIGSALITTALEMLRGRGCPFVVLVGHPEYYPRFGFRRASESHLACQWPEVPDDAFMAVILDQEAMQSVSGTVKYRPEFDVSAVSIRPGRPDDWQAMRELYAEAGRSAWRHILHEETLAALSAPDRWRPDAGADVLVAERAGEVVGFISVGPSADKGAASAVGAIGALYVHPSHWGGGAGRALLSAGVQRLATAGFEEMTVWTEHRNHRPLKFYIAAGWTLDDAERRYSVGGTEIREVRLRLKL